MPSGAKKRKAAKRKQQKGGAHVDAPANSQEGNSGRDEDDRSSHGEIETLTPLEGSDSKYSSDPNNTMEEAANGGPAVEGDLPPVPNPSENVRVEFVQSVDIVNGQDESSSESSSDDDQRSGEVTPAERGLEISGDESLCEEAATPKGVVAENETFGVTHPVVGVEAESCVATPEIPEIPVTESEEIPATPFIESEEVVILETPIIEAEGAAIPATPATPFVEAEGVAIPATPLVENEGVAIPATPLVEAEGVAIPAAPFVEAESSAIPFVEAEGAAIPATPFAEAEGVMIPATPTTPETPFIESEEVVTPVTPVIESEGAVNSTLKEIEEKINSSPKIPSEKPRDVHFPQDLENLDRTDNEINSAPLPVQTTSWKGCCGLLELLGVSNR